ncbi:early nodulin-like protein 17 [Gastrolobium bilobum]|uniref:early nodulin-like protein 17 n=1 Tax=Gastrolobium bilobum TaxID=150636 RepID=UPI002AB09A62|nr:early nodulin-like protein 17 [Gastrolobium bilobum]
MEGTKRVFMVLLFLGCTMLVMLPQASAVRWMIGGNMGWSTNFNYTTWAKGKHFYNGDWLFFVYDRNQMNVLEVNKTDYESCNSDHPRHNWTTGAGRDVVPLNVTRDYYFISGKGFCFGGMKIAVHVENPPPPPVAAPIRAGAHTLSSQGHIILLPVVYAIGAAWDAFIHFW